jgi:hypothetical protein
MSYPTVNYSNVAAGQAIAATTSVYRATAHAACPNRVDLTKTAAHAADTKRHSLRQAGNRLHATETK